jgi:hypothetical protein
MNKTRFYFLLFTFYFLFSTNSFALVPVFIKKSESGAPPAGNPYMDDSDYFPNGLGLVCEGTFTISQTFEPDKKVTKDSKGNETVTFKPFDVTKIVGAAPGFNHGFWTNSQAEGHVRATNSNPRTLANADDINRAFMSYDPDGLEGAIGTGNKNMPDSVLKCLVGQRLVNAVILANNSGGGVVTNEQVAWYDGGTAKPVIGNESGSGQKVQLDDIAITLDQNRFLSLTETDANGRALPSTEENLIFYDPDDNCYNNDPTDRANPIPTPGRLGNFTTPNSDSYEPIDPSEAAKLYKTIGPEGGGASMRRIWVYNKDHGRNVEPEIKKTSMPRGEALASANSLKIITYEGQEIPKLNKYCKIHDEPEIRDRPNGLFYTIKYALEEFGRVFDTRRTFSKTLTYRVHQDYNIKNNVEIDEVARKNLFPQYVFDENPGLDDPNTPYTTTDKYSFDPGNSRTYNLHVSQLQPENMKF